MTTSTIGKAQVYSEEIALALDDEFKRIGCYDLGSGGLIACEKDGSLAVADMDVFLVVEGVLERVKEYPDNYLEGLTYDDPEWNIFWHDALGDVG